MAKTEEQDPQTNQGKMLKCMPIHLVNSKVHEFMETLRSKAGDSTSGREPYNVALRDIVQNTLIAELSQWFGPCGQVLARQLGQFAAVISLGSDKVDRELGGRRVEITHVMEKAEADHAAQTLIRTWFDTLVVYVYPKQTPQGQIRIDGLLFPKQAGTEAMEGKVPNRFDQAQSCPTTWRDVFLRNTRHLALDEQATIDIWRVFAHEFKLMIHGNTGRHTDLSSGFLIDRDQDNEFFIVYDENTDRYHFTWRLIDSPT